MFWRNFVRDNDALHLELRVRAARWTQTIAGMAVPFLSAMLEEYIIMLPGFNVVLDAPSWSAVEQTLRNEVTTQEATIQNWLATDPNSGCIGCIQNLRQIVAIPCGHLVFCTHCATNHILALANANQPIRCPMGYQNVNFYRIFT